MRKKINIYISQENTYNKIHIIYKQENLFQKKDKADFGTLKVGHLNLISDLCEV